MEASAKISELEGVSREEERKRAKNRAERQSIKFTWWLSLSWMQMLEVCVQESHTGPFTDAQPLCNKATNALCRGPAKGPTRQASTMTNCSDGPSLLLPAAYMLMTYGERFILFKMVEFVGMQTLEENVFFSAQWTQFRAGDPLRHLPQIKWNGSECADIFFYFAFSRFW